MPNATSSQIGVDLNNPNSTQLFALGTKVLGTGDSEWTYVMATGTLTTGQLVQITPTGTAIAYTTAILASTSTTDFDVAVAQFTVPQGQYAYVAKRGHAIYVLCTGTIAMGVGVGLSPTAGSLIVASSVAAGCTMAGIFLEASSSTATASITTATMQWPRFLSAATSVQG